MAYSIQYRKRKRDYLIWLYRRIIRNTECLLLIFLISIIFTHLSRYFIKSTTSQIQGINGKNWNIIFVIDDDQHANSLQPLYCNLHRKRKAENVYTHIIVTGREISGRKLIKSNSLFPNCDVPVYDLKLQKGNENIITSVINSALDQIQPEVLIYINEPKNEVMNDVDAALATVSQTNRNITKIAIPIEHTKNMMWLTDLSIEELKIITQDRPLSLSHPSQSLNSSIYFSDDVSDNEINRKYCNTNECKFLFTYNFIEQETQSNRHFISFIQIAQQLGRTVVLTNVGGSGISLLKNFSFDLYYDVDGLSRKFPKVKFISQHKFQKWAEERYNKPDVIHVLLENSNINPNYTIQYDTSYFDKLLREYRMDKFDLKLNNSAIFKRISIGTTANDSRKGQENYELNQFLKAELESNAEVMLITHDVIRGPIFERLSPMPYARHITNAASRLAKKLKPYIAIHWRMEQGQENLMPKCAESLVTYIRNLSLTTGIKNIYLATDYPLATYNENNKAQSCTFSNINENHHTAMKILQSSFNVNTWVSTHALDYLQLYLIRSEQLQEELSGGGIQGIFDKLILIHADYFIAGPKECCRFKSTYTYNVMETRQELFEKNGTVKNIIDLWEL
ncbi:20343_t:CDS:2 [Dentiscutata erythropus]|uniref:GDP-fucose protein O-fucosyltransferase 2 n=1 Tax=Dentiscutata erythropus TaxID=1348616 RepID=A0A9N8WLU7_9GLOM|nr:20343_t:CDS:2 [Dentiscutata erythropus]